MSHSIRFQVSGLTGWDAVWVWLLSWLSERWAATYVARQVLASAYRGARFTDGNPLLLTMPNGRVWEVFHKFVGDAEHPDSYRVIAQLPTRQHEPTPPRGQ